MLITISEKHVTEKLGKDWTLATDLPRGKLIRGQSYLRGILGEESCMIFIHDGIVQTSMGLDYLVSLYQPLPKNAVVSLTQD